MSIWRVSMIKYFAFIVLVNAGFFWLLNFLRDKLNISRKTVISIVITTFMFGAFFPLALSFFSTYQVLVVIFFGIIGVSVLLGRRSEVTRVHNDDGSIVIEDGPMVSENEIMAVTQDEVAASLWKPLEEVDERIAPADEIEEDLSEEFNPEVTFRDERTTDEFAEEEGKNQEDVVILMEPDEEETFPEIGVIENFTGDNNQDIDQAAEEAVAGMADRNTGIDKLNAYIDEGFKAKFAGDRMVAILSFLRAIELDPPADLLRMISLDVFSMYKELGQYSEAKAFLNRYLEGYGNTLSQQECKDIMVNIKQVEILEEMLAEWKENV